MATQLTVVAPLLLIGDVIKHQNEVGAQNKIPEFAYFEKRNCEKV